MDAGFTQSYAKFRPCMPKKNISRASSDTYLKWLLGPDQDLVFTFSNPALVQLSKNHINDSPPCTQ